MARDQITPQLMEELKKEVGESFNGFLEAYNAGDYDKAVKYGDLIRNCGLTLSSIAWNRAIDESDKRCKNG